MNPFENQLMLSRRNGVVDGYLLPGTKIAGVRLGDGHVYRELVAVEQAALRKGPRMNGLGDTTSPAMMAATYSAWASSPAGIAYGVLGAASAAISAVHGYRRHRGSIGWALGWAFCGGLFPVITPAIAYAEGFGKPIKR